MRLTCLQNALTIPIVAMCGCCCVLCYRHLPCTCRLSCGIPTDSPIAHCRLTQAAELLRSYALARGWVAAGGLPDETRSGRQILKDFVNGKLLHCERPPGCTLSNAQLGLQGQAMNSVPARQAASQASTAALNGSSAEAQTQLASSEDDAVSSASGGAESVEPSGSEADTEVLASSAGPAPEARLSAADRELMQSMAPEGKTSTFALKLFNSC